MAFEGLLRAWSNERTLARDASHCLVDKPAGIPCGPAGSAFVGGSLEARLESHGLGRWRALLELPERASGVTLLVPARELAETPDATSAQLPQELEQLELVVGIDACRLSASGVL